MPTLSLPRLAGLLAVCCLLIPTLSAAPATAAAPASQPVRKLLARHGQGYLETVDGYRVLHLKGSPEEMGQQHGALLKDSIAANLDNLLRPEGGRSLSGAVARTAVGVALNSTFEKRIPPRFVAEMNALARAAGLPPWKIASANLIPEMFHCSGFALLKQATADGKLLHGRVLDYGVNMKLQEHAVLIIQEPQGAIPFVNVSYAGFIGSVTGMNLEQISIGEMGGGGVGKWAGIPMSFLVRMVLEEARTLDQAVEVFKKNPRTCEYFYVIADARANSAVGMKAVPESVETVGPGEKHPLLPTPVMHTVLLSAGQRYQHLAKKVGDGHGRFTESAAIRLMDAPVAMRSNLHNALMVPADAVVHVANADARGNPAWKQPYHRFDIRQLMSSQPRP